MNKAVYISPEPIPLGMLLEGDVDNDREIPSVGLAILVVVETVGAMLVVEIPNRSSDRLNAQESRTVLANVRGSLE